MKRVPLAEKFSFANGSNANFIEAVYQQYLKDPDSVEESWQRFFDGYEFAENQMDKSHLSQEGVTAERVRLESKVEAYITLFRRSGHKYAKIDPLNQGIPEGKELSIEANGLGAVDDEDLFYPANLPVGDGIKFREIKELLAKTYCGSIGADFRDVVSEEAVSWFQHIMEANRNRPSVSKEIQMRILEKLIESEGFEKFLHDRYLGQKRFSLEGLESLIPLLDVIIKEAGDAGAEEICLGMAHRGRLNVLANFMGKPFDKIFKEFEGTEAQNFDIDGDVKYHMGFANAVQTSSGKTVRLFLAPNPSHLEAVNPVVEGFTSARQILASDVTKEKFIPILIHGDAAFIGQGIVAETINLSHLPAYGTGGTIHIITNNQVGFTTDPFESRSCYYSSDIAKIVHAPVLHVNADDPESVIWCGLLATLYRQKFKSDIVIDLVGYRRHGHNETDEPSFTQPLLYKKIKLHKTTLALYGEKLVREKVCTEEEINNRKKAFRQSLQKQLERVRGGEAPADFDYPPEFYDALKHVRVSAKDLFTKVQTAIPEGELRSIANNMSRLPKEFTPHPKIAKLYKNRLKMLEGKGRIDWGMAELLTYGSLSWQGIAVRLSGQDCQRGTFSHRHAVINDTLTGNRFSVFDNVSPKRPGLVTVVNSPLSEAGVLGFEFGYSVGNPAALVLWEAQFGDFSNGAQIIIDQFLSASEAKWKQSSSLVLLLPHGYEGAGPEHSSARPERFLQLCGNFNMQVANLTEPAQLFHLLRRQALREFRKPLVILTPKSLLRHPKVVSTWDHFASGGFFEVIDDPAVKNKKAVKRIVFCNGKIFYELDQVRSEYDNLDDTVAIVRIEQLYPFPEDIVSNLIETYPGATEVIWAQEEPSNMGAWTFIRHRIKKLALRRSSFRYVGRKGAGTTAEGSLRSHQVEQQRIIQESLGLLEPVVKKSPGSPVQ